MAKQISKMMPYSSLIKEHEKLVKVLKSGNKKAIAKMAKEQEKELKEYKEEYHIKKKFRRKK